ncbi:MAG: ABC transporter substrate-binding protein, partial [Paucibacter sp.]|nr:ABC transporter substrate-binding protein [Roseateles sp.]
MKPRFVSSLVAASLLALMLGPVHAQAQAPAKVEIKDDLDHTTQWSRPPQRIVTLLPSLTETVCALGACERLVGVDRYSNFPEALNKL